MINKQPEAHINIAVEAVEGGLKLAVATPLLSATYLLPEANVSQFIQACREAQKKIPRIVSPKESARA